MDFPERISINWLFSSDIIAICITLVIYIIVGIVKFHVLQIPVNGDAGHGWIPTLTYPSSAPIS